MQKFLIQVAEKIIADYSNNLNDQCIVFPNRRSALFFTRYLAGLTDRPVWMPTLKTVNELFTDNAVLKIAEPIQLIIELYKDYNILTNKSESLDDFYFWGEMLINDFDDIDKYLAPAELIFTNLSDLKRIDEQFGGLSPEVWK